MIKVFNRKKNEGIFDSLILVLMFAVMISMIFIGIKLNAFKSNYAMVNFIICYICGVFSIILYICCMTSESNDRLLIVLFEIMVFVLVLSLLVTETYVSMDGIVEYSKTSFALMTADYLLSIGLISLFWFYQARCLKQYYNFSTANKIFICFIVLYVSAIIVNVFYPIMFYVDGAGHLQFSDSVTISALELIWIVFYIAVISRVNAPRKLKLYYMSYLLFPLAIIVLSAIWLVLGIQNKYDAVVSVAYLVPLYMIFMKIYKDQNKLLRDKEQELSEKNMQMMLSQIQPHFLYNALSAISAIPNTPDETRDALSDFGKYLRGNLNSLNEREPIPFYQEIKHVDTYLVLEKLRFGDKLIVEYEFNERDFCVPALSLQMFVENAVKHGITKKESGGKLFIKTELVEKNYVVTIEDNGVGFNVGEFDVQKTEGHVGIKNAKSRIKNMVNGTVDIKSEIGEGTIVTITIPKTGETEK